MYAGAVWYTAIEHGTIPDNSSWACNILAGELHLQPKVKVTQNLFDLSRIMSKSSIKFQKYLTSSFWVILLTDKQTNTGENLTSLAEAKRKNIGSQNVQDARCRNAVMFDRCRDEPLRGYFQCLSSSCFEYKIYLQLHSMKEPWYLGSGYGVRFSSGSCTFFCFGFWSVRS